MTTPLPVGQVVACSNGDCTEFETEKEIHLQELTTNVYAVTRVVCSVCSYEVVFIRALP